MNSLTQNSKRIWPIIVAVVIITSVVIGGGVYLWQKLVLKYETPTGTPELTNAASQTLPATPENTQPGVAEENLCDKEIVLDQKFGQKLSIDYCTHLVNDNNLKIYFSYNTGNLVIYTTKNFENENLLLDSLEFSYYPSVYTTGNIYANGEKIKINYFDEDGAEIIVEDSCPSDYPYCNLVSKDITSYYFTENDVSKYYFDNALFPSLKIRDDYIAKVKNFDKKGLDLLRNFLGIYPPIDKVVQFDLYLPESHISYERGFSITNSRSSPISEENVKNLTYGNTHEFVHVFFNGIPVAHKSWFEEGLADYMEHLDQNKLSSISCQDNGWQEGYYSNGEFTATSPFVPYSDFTVAPQFNVEMYHPLNKSSYYRSAECFWIYINKTYGENAIKKVAQAWQNIRKILPPQKKWFIGDIVNPALGADLSSIVYARYAHVEE